MNILLLHAYSRHNKGDAAILSVMVKELKETFPGSSFRISSLDGESIGKDFEGALVEASLFYGIIYASKSSLAKLVNLIKVYFGSYSVETQTFSNSLKWADVFVGVGGGYINSRKGLKSILSLWLTMQEFKLAQKTGKPIILFPQSIGPFAYDFHKKMIQTILKKIKLIFAREHITLKLLQDMGLQEPQIAWSPDMGFSFSSDKKQSMKEHMQKMHINFSKPIVGITVRKWLSGEGQGKYELVISEFADWLISEKYMQVVFIPQVTSVLHNDDDREVQKRIIEKMKTKKEVWSLEEQFDHYEIKGIYENMSYVVGTRMHSVIFALTSFVPAIAIAYEYKSEGIMEDLHLGEWVVALENVSSEDLKSSFNHLELESHNYKEKLASVLPAYIKSSTVRTNLIKKFVSLNEK